MQLGKVVLSGTFFFLTGLPAPQLRCIEYVEVSILSSSSSIVQLGSISNILFQIQWEYNNESLAVDIVVVSIQAHIWMLAAVCATSTGKHWLLAADGVQTHENAGLWLLSVLQSSSSYRAWALALGCKNNQQTPAVALASDTGRQHLLMHSICSKQCSQNYG
jgi:endonuclease/exonuclease/phosphatase (EEP) superfamily protein YafD